MLLRRESHRPAPRRGVILMVVLAMLTLFSIVGITFVLFADAAAMSARINRETETMIRPDIDPELAMSFFLGQLIYDVHDDAQGCKSALRGSSFARSMYGANFTATGAFDANQQPYYTGDNSLPYCGVGRFHTTTSPLGANIDEYNYPNYQYFPADTLLNGQVRDPEHTGNRGSPAAAFAANTYLAGNASYTYCDGNSMFLAYMNSTTGEIQVPSFHRNWMFGALDNGINLNWTNKAGKYMTLRPRPQEHPNFPYPQDLGGDVKNADWAPGGCDSIWIDVGAPVMTMADGRKYKMLIAPLIFDLDGRLNLNVAGNILGTANAHRSNQGWGPWEMNPGKVLNATFSAAATNEWHNLFLASTYTTTTNTYGRYGANVQPDGAAPPTGTYLHDYGQIDFNAKIDPGQAGAGGATGQYLLAGAAGNPNNRWYPFPYFPPTGYGNGAPTETTPYHPAQYNSLRTPTSLVNANATPDDLRFSVQSMHAVLRGGGTGSEFVTTDLRVLAGNLALDPTPSLSLKRRNQITTLSMDLDRPSIIPYLWNTGDYQMSQNATVTNTPLQPTGGTQTFPTLAQLGMTPSPSEFDATTWRSLYAQLGRVNLNRTLRHYPNLAPNNTTTGVLNATAPGNIQTEYLAAVQDRQQLAQDIYNVLQKTTGTVDFTVVANRTTYPVTSGQYQAARWLAQLAVNIVDYIDEDDYMTPFNWDPQNTTVGDSGWVFGVEAPRLTLNEAYAQLDNDNSDAQIHVTDNPATMTYKYAKLAYRMNLWLELHNPMPTDVPATNPLGHEHGNPNAQLQLNMTVNGQANQPVPVYQVLMVPFGPTTAATALGAPLPSLFTPNTGALTNPANVTGDPDFLTPPPGQSRIVSTVGGATANPWGNTVAQHTVTASNGAYNGTSTTGFYVLGAQPPAGQGGAYDNAADNPNITPTLASAQMSYPVPLGSVAAGGTTMPSVDVVLQRLACPHLPPNPLPGKTITLTTGVIQYNPALPPNPYITTDLLELTGTNNVTAPTQVWDSRRFLLGPAQNTDHVNTPAPVAINTRLSYGRIQPYAAVAATGGVVGTGGLAAQNPVAPPAVPINEPKNTFFRHNARQGNPPTAAQLAAAGQTLKTSFDWLTHLDRILISPMELMNVSAVKPHELTHYFQNGCTQNSSNNPSLHLAQWTNPNARLARAFEFLTSGSLQNGYAVGGRVPGKINVNTMGPADIEVFRAICDAQAGNTFTAAQVDLIFNGQPALTPPIPGFLQVRSPNSVPGANDKPFLSMATGQASGNDLVTTTQRSIANTLLQPQPIAGAGPNTQRLLEANTPGTTGHPYQRYELLNKIYNNLTVRSNVFAVFMTVGFFSVDNDQTTPVTLGAEIGRTENRHIRHRMFAIVDRTNLQEFSTTLKAGNAGTITVPAANANGIATTPSFIVKNINGNTGVLTATTGTNTTTNLQWNVQAGTMLTVDANTNTEETVTVFSTTTTGANGMATTVLQARFFQSHTAGATVIVRGNPGPWLRYNLRSDTAVVPYFAVID